MVTVLSCQELAVGRWHLFAFAPAVLFPTSVLRLAGIAAILTYSGEVQNRSWMAVLDDLHKGRDCGPVWSWVIDVSAVLLTVLSLTGIWLLFYLKKRRRSGLIVGLVGCVLVVVSYVFGVH